MASKKKSAAPIEFAKVNDRTIEMSFDDLLGAAFDTVSVTKADRAIARLSSGGIPVIIQILSNDSLAPALIAIDPTLKLSELDEACGKLEDLAILILSTARAARHEVGEDFARANPTAMALYSYAADALEVADLLEEMDLLKKDELDRNRKLLRSATAGRPKAARGS